MIQRQETRFGGVGGLVCESSRWVRLEMREGRILLSGGRAVASGFMRSTTSRWRAISIPAGLRVLDQADAANLGCACRSLVCLYQSMRMAFVRDQPRERSRRDTSDLC